jgi:hypothetical protein
MKIEVNLNDAWVDEVVAASLRDFIRRDYNTPDVPIKAMKKVLKFYSVREDYTDFMEDIKELDDIHSHQLRFDF